jgi:spermidine synthase
VFVTGAAVLALELLASRFMVPAFGTSIFIWGAVLSVTLACLAFGYRWAGVLADRDPRPDRRLLVHVALAGAWIAAFPAWGPLLLRLGLAAGSYAGPVVVALGLFAVPLTLLATTVPLGFGACARDGERHGRLVGDLFAVSTAGSVAGALATAYLAIPVLGVPRSFLVTAAVLVVTAGVQWRRVLPGALALALAAAGLGRAVVAPPAWAEGVTLRYARDSRYGHLAVIDHAPTRGRVLLLDGASQNWALGPDWQGSEFRYVSAAREVAAGLRGRALVLGLGGGTLVRGLAADGFAVDVVELDPAMPAVARAYFGLAAADARVIHADARAFLDRAAAGDARYALIVVDVSGGGQHPDHVYSREAFALMRAVLAPGGTVVLNLVVFTKPADAVARHVVATARAVFERVVAYDLSPSWDAAELNAGLVVATAGETRPAPRGAAPLATAAADVLTDAWNPLGLWSIRANAVWHANMRRRFGEAAAMPYGGW